MTVRKRLFDLFWCLVLLLPLLPLGVLIAVAVLFLDGRPVFYLSERMKSPTRSFSLVKFRTMKPSARNAGVSGQDKAHRITSLGTFLRRTRLDEIPQLWNIFRGDMSFVGPRPPLRQYVERFPDLYAQVLRSRPGVTGLATLIFKDAEARLLAACVTAEETDVIYARRCVPRKAALDLLYQRHASLCWDAKLMLATLIRSVPKK